jgi:hypothetical protein
METMPEKWKSIQNFENYSVSDWGRVRSEKSGRILALSQNQFDVVYVGLVRDGKQYHRSVPLLVANAFIPRQFEPYDTPINLSGDRWNNSVSNLVWRPRWFAIKYNQQFKFPYEYPIIYPIEDIKTGEVSQDSFDCARRYGLLEKDLVLSILNRTYVWPTYQQFRVVRV